MSRITKEIASSIARKLVEDKKKIISSLESKFKQRVKEEFLKTLPFEVIEFSNHFPNFVNKGESLELSGNG